jgi:hypothetical protein
MTLMVASIAFDFETKSEDQEMALLRSRPNVSFKQEHQTFGKGSKSSESDPGCVKTRTGLVSAHELNNFMRLHREISDVSRHTRHKIALTSDPSAFLHNQDPVRTHLNFHIAPVFAGPPISSVP